MRMHLLLRNSASTISVQSRLSYKHFFTYNITLFFAQCLWIFSQSSTYLHAVALPAIVYLDFARTFLAHMGLFLILSLLQTMIFLGGQRCLLRWHAEKLRWFVWILSIAAIWFANMYFFPLSRFSRVWGVSTHNLFVVAFFIGASAPLLLFFGCFIYQYLRKSLVLSIVIVILGVVFYINLPSRLVRNSNDAHPNIIIIGIDSLVLRMINAKDTPTLAALHQKSVVFTNTISPLARTYPAWTSLLTGLYPHHHHATYNLISSENVRSDESIAWSLRKLGYDTVFATDDRRFNSVDDAFGFTTIIGPKIGVNDVFLGTFNDFPLSNLLINTSLGAWLFPYNHMSRASYFSYYPAVFDRALKNHIMLLMEKGKPLFLAVHYTLPHWPYAWAATPTNALGNEFDVHGRVRLYRGALRAADQQVKKLLQTLSETGYLQNALLIVLSDHGETLYLPGSRDISLSAYQHKSPSRLLRYFKEKTATEYDKSAGHGSDLLSPDQYHCLCIVSRYKNGQPTLSTRIVTENISLIDIAPTLASVAGISLLPIRDGISLYNVIFHKKTPPRRAFIMESGMCPNQFFSHRKLQILGKKFFTINSVSGRLEIRADALSMLDAMKLYAIIEGHWLFALYPGDSHYIPIIQDLNNKHWSDIWQDDFGVKSPEITLLAKLENFYQKTFDKEL